MSILGTTQSTNDSSDQWCDIRTAAKHIGMSVAFLRKQVRMKRVPHARVGSKALRFRCDDLDAWLESHGHGGELTYRPSTN